MSLILAVFLLIIGFILLTKGADYFIENSASFAEEKGISPHVVGVTIVAFGTSLPELLVSIISSIQGYNDLALGNIVGSNISNIGLVLSVSTFIFYYVLKTNILPDEDANNDSYVMLLAVLMLYFFAIDKSISQIEGAVFFSLYIIYIFWLYKRTKGDEVSTDESKTSYMFLIGGLIALLIGAQLTVDSAVEIALAIGIPEIVIGLSVVAVGTSLPELAGTISAARMGHKEIAVGNVIGSNIANIFLVMGVLSLINPIAVEDFVVDQTLPLLIILTIVTFGLIRIPLNRLSGSLLFAFFLFFIYQLTFI
ncbi:MAG: calcium/sodium antiporter [Gammaproteobacteria bacterium]|nr:calcium/sodium antiporter [Candidatus Poseidoniia archaeon]MCH2652539.1 calcium/sodium antiporter [Gammaproteobacteria bacterium]|tara:strand:+ start:307 stop:1233 length:927 start_codon:yes stop_codon:yes gene_type:complete